jgi:hypothetical protein
MRLALSNDSECIQTVHDYVRLRKTLRLDKLLIIHSAISKASKEKLPDR